MALRRQWRRHLVSIACLALAGLIAAAAIVDHEWKSRRINRAELATWYCEHESIYCGGASPVAMERHWNERQLAYEAAVIALAGFAVGRVAVRAARS